MMYFKITVLIVYEFYLSRFRGTLIGSDYLQVFENYKLDNMVWLAFLEFGQSLQDLVGDSNIRFDVQFLVAQPADTEVQLLEVYRVAPGTPLRVHLFGALRESLTAAHTYVYHRRKSFGGHTMRTSSLNVSAAVMAV
jgi:hypothetical protein